MYSIVQNAQADVLTSLTLEEHSFHKILAKIQAPANVITI